VFENADNGTLSLEELENKYERFTAFEGSETPKSKKLLLPEAGSDDEEKVLVPKVKFQKSEKPSKLSLSFNRSRWFYRSSRWYLY